MPKLPGVKNTKRKLRELAYKGLYELAKRYDYIANDIKRYEQRLAYELNIINYKDFADYIGNITDAVGNIKVNVSSSSGSSGGGSFSSSSSGSSSSSNTGGTTATAKSYHVIYSTTENNVKIDPRASVRTVNGVNLIPTSDGYYVK